MTAAVVAASRVGPALAGTVVTADVAATVQAYVGALDLQVVRDAPLPAAVAQAWGKPALAGHRFVVLGADSADPSTHWLRVLEVPGAPAPAPMRQRGWLALEVLVRDVQALGRRLEGGPFRVLGTPRPLSVSDDIWAMQVAGPAGETLYLTEVRAQVPPFELPMNARHTAERLFIPVLSAPDRESALAWYAARAGGSGLRFDSRVSALSRALGLDPEHRRAVATLALAGRSVIEIDEVPEHPPAPALAVGLPAGLAMVSLYADDATTWPRLEQGPAGEWIEWLPHAAA